MGEQAECVEPEKAGVLRVGRFRERAAIRDAGDAPFGPHALERPQGIGRSRRRRPSARRWIAGQLAEEGRYGQGFLWLPVIMAAGAAMELAAPQEIPLPALAVPLGLLAVLAVVMQVRGWRGAPLLLLASALFAGLTAAAVQVRLEHATLLDGPVVTHLTGVVLSREAAGKSGWRYLVRVTSTSSPVIRRPPERVRLVARGKGAPIEPGQGIGGVARLLPPSGPALPGGYDFGFNSYFQGIGAIGFFYGPPHRVAVAGSDGRGLAADLANAVARLRQAIDRRVRAVLAGDEGALAAALIVADRGGIPEPVVAALRDAGLAHILAISGLHMALVAGTVLLVLRLLFALSLTATESLPAKKIAAGAALFVATAYLVISGAAVSTLRAWIMLALVLVAVLLDRPALTLRNVAIAAIVIILTDPAAVVGPSFQMSFAATTALVAGYSALRQYRGRRHGERADAMPFGFVIRFAGAIAFTSLVAGAATDIFAAYHFHRIALFGIVGNLLAMPLITFVVMPMGLLAVLLMPYGLEAWPLTLMGRALDAVIAIAFRVQALGGTAATGRMPVGVLLLFVAGFAVLVLLRSRLRVAGLVAIAAALLLDISLLAPRRPDILVSEDGTVVGLPVQGGIASNRRRPSSFVFDEWLATLGETRAVAPVQIAGSSGHPSARHRPQTKDEAPADPAAVAAMRAALDRHPARFLCYGAKWCAADVAQGLPLVTVSDPAFVGPACDLAGIVVVARPPRITNCRAGVLLITGPALRRSGSIEIAVDRVLDVSGVDPWIRGEERQDRATRVAAGPGTAYRLTVRSALGGVIRPWTVQRYYDWRSRGFDFGAAAPGTRTLVISAD